MNALRERTLRRRAWTRPGAVLIAALCLGSLAAQAAGAAGSAPRNGVPPYDRPSAVIRAAEAALRSAAYGPGPFHQTRTISRINLINGQNVVVDRRTVSLSVNVTRNLIGRQEITVRWRGAHPTGGIYNNPNQGSAAEFEEYPMVLVECHGMPGSKAPLAQQITPQDCWTSTPSERFWAAIDPFPAWRLDRYATAAGQRNLTVNQPNPLPITCGLLPGPHFWLDYRSPSGHKYPVGPGGCAGEPNNMSFIGGIGLLPSNETFAATGLDGKGTSTFDVWNNENNTDLGCSQTVPCALVAIPIMGVSCDPTAASMPPADQPTPAEEPAAAAACEQTGYWPPGSFASSGNNQYDLSVSGQLWWAASNWRNKFVVPLTFAPPQNICQIVSKNKLNLQIYGSELMDQAMLQWQPHFCLSRKLFNLSYISTPEPEAAGQLASGSLDAALLSQQPSTTLNPVVHAPVAESGFAISFVIDNAQGQPVRTLRLDPRLLAKLLTESYPYAVDIALGDPELLHPCPGVPVPGSTQCTNPLNITEDPEFQALNPGIAHGVGASAAASVLLALSSSSDVMFALTSYINADPAAHAFMTGHPDPWGMRINANYQGLKLPTSTWPLLSTYEPPGWVLTGGSPGLCYAQNPVPVLPLVAAPVPDLFDLAEDIQFYNSQSQLQCVGDPNQPRDFHLAALGPQVVRFRFMIGISTIADARRYQLGAAELLTHIKAGTPAKFTSAAGMTFVGPTDAGLRAAAGLLVPDKKNLTWNFPYSLYGADRAKVSAAYPGAMLVYADVPTKSLPAATAGGFAKFLHFAATQGQVPGTRVGQLPTGYLPLTSANHLGAQAAYTKADAAAVAAQAGTIPALITNNNPHPSPSPTPSPSSSAAPGSSGSTSPSPSGSSPSSSSSPTGSAGPPITLTPMANFGVLGDLLPALLILALLTGIASFVVTRITRAKVAGPAGPPGQARPGFAARVLGATRRLGRR
jgi:hypothetical protein